ncbi:SpoIIE family protein phosphatase [Kitasatospora kifunensis]|uniref:PAS domain S-box-containing protein n=1 Tax=Kitasatospora kifunensis TaxID=58351 RepID=A0A7W7VTI8_KITKI|nr:SpoIIE family protein phosphatase [Kitasatospora kifunensis]MBB4921674.1 PAS domain S-box-containing protein [Kitasatospora kifunensis]
MAHHQPRSFDRSDRADPKTLLAFLDDEQARALLGALASEGADHHREFDLLLTDYRLARQILDRSMVGIAVFDLELRYRYVNRTLAEINGVRAEEHTGRRISEVIPGIDVSAAESALHTVLADGEPRTHIVEGTTASGPPTELRWWHNAYHRLDDPAGAPLGVVAMVLEITEDRRIRRALNRARTRLALLDEAATRIGTTLDVEQASKELTRLLVPQLADVALVDVLEPSRHAADHPPEGGLRMRRLALSSTPALVATGSAVGGAGALIEPQAGSAATRCVLGRTPIVLNFPSDDELRTHATNAERVSHYRRLGLHSAVYVPLTASGTVIGVVLLARGGASPGFTPDEVALMVELASRAGSGISNAQRYSHEHESTLALQRALLAEPMRPHSDVESVGRYLPAGASAEVGGDWYDTVALPGGRTLLVVGDVMGHGLDAAATMSEYRTLVRALALQRRSPAGILREAERIVGSLEQERVATCVLALLDPAARTCTFASAGHLPPLLLDPRGPARLLRPPVAPPLGAGVGGHQQVTVPFAASATLLLYTDGLVERRNRDIEQSLDALTALDFDPTAPLEHLIDTALTGLAAGHGEDDVAVLATRLAGPPAPPPVFKFS